MDQSWQKESQPKDSQQNESIVSDMYAPLGQCKDDFLGYQPYQSSYMAELSQNIKQSSQHAATSTRRELAQEQPEYRYYQTPIKSFLMNGDLAPRQSLTQLQRILGQEQPSNIFQFSTFLSSKYTTREKLVRCRVFPASPPFSSLNQQNKQSPSPILTQKPSRPISRQINSSQHTKLKSIRLKRNSPLGSGQLVLFPLREDQNFKQLQPLSATLNTSSLPARKPRKRPRTTQHLRIQNTEAKGIPLGSLLWDKQNIQLNPHTASQITQTEGCRLKVVAAKQRQIIPFKELIKQKKEDQNDSILFPVEVDRSSALSSELKHQYLKIERIIEDHNGDAMLIPQAITSMRNQRYNQKKNFRLHTPSKQLSHQDQASEYNRSVSTYSQRKRHLEEQIQKQLEEQTEEKERDYQQKILKFKQDIEKLKSFTDLRNVSSRLESKLKKVEVGQFRRKIQP